MSDVTSPSYRSGLAAGLGVVLSAALVLAIVDIAHTGGAPLPLLGLWALVAIPFALATGIVLGAGNAQWGPRWVRGFFRKLRDDAELDRAVSAALLAAVVLAGVLALGVSVLAMNLVAKVMRQKIGSQLLGVVVVAMIPILAILAIPLFRAARQVTRFVPAIGPLSRTVALVLAGVASAVAAAAFIVYTKLDHQNMKLGSLIALAMLPVVSLAIGLLVYGPLAGVRERLPARGIAPIVGLAIAIVLPVVGLRAPSEETKATVIDRSYIGSFLVPNLRKFIDRDGDSQSAFFGGPDCNDSDPNVKQGADEIPGNGIDDNCIGGDGKADTAGPTPAGNGGGSAGPVAPPTKPTIDGGKNVLVIFVDTLRADRMGYVGYQRDGKSMTPRIDAFAKDAVVFEQAYAQAPNTPRSVPSFLTSKYPSQLKVDRATRDYPTILDDGNDFLFEALKPAGFKTIGMTSHFYFCDRTRDPKSCDGVVTWMNSNTLQGADEWNNDGALNIPESNKDVAGPRIVAKSVAKLEELAKADQKFAMMVHLFEPHSTYVEFPEYKYSGSGGERLSQRYDYEIHVVDQRIGELLDALDKTGLAKTTTVVIMSDHGEAFGVHRFAGEQMFFHGQTLYRELLHVPLLFRVPGVPGKRVKEVVELMDLAPTIAALFGVAPPKSWRGRSLVPALEGKPLDQQRAAYAELLPADKWNYAGKSMITADGTRHVYYRISESQWEIYDLAADPEERKNVNASDPKAAELQQQLTNWIEGSLASGRN